MKRNAELKRSPLHRGTTQLKRTRMNPQSAIDAALAEKDAEIATLRAKLANSIPAPTTAGGPTV